MRWWALLVALGLVGGHAFDDQRPEPLATRAGRLVFHADLHVHTRLSDGFVSPFELVFSARRQGLDAFAVTEHNNVFPAHAARWFSELVGGPLVIVGEEITTRDFHLLAYGIEHAVRPRRDVRAVIDEVHAQGGVAIAAHPVRRYWDVFDSAADVLDGSEVVHPAAYADSEMFRWSDMVTFHERAKLRSRAWTSVGTSDYHFFKVLGLGRTLVFAESPTADALVDALRAGKTVVEAPDGRRFGDSELIAALEREPLPARRDRVGYHAEPLNVVARLLGWLGVVGLLIARRKDPHGD